MSNSLQKYIFKVKKEQRKADAAINAPAVKKTVSWLGDNNGIMDTLRGKKLPKSYVVVRDYDGNLSVAYNPNVPAIANLMVNVGYDPLQPTKYMVLGIADYLSINPPTTLVIHHETHEWPGSDTTFIHSEQYLPGLLLAGSGMIVAVYPFFFKKSDGSRGLVSNQSLDLTTYIPSTGAQAYTLAVDDSGTLQLIPGGVQISLALITVIDFPTNTDITLHDLWGIRLYKGQSVVRQTAGYSDVFDFRMGGIQGGASGYANKIDGGSASTY